MLFSSPVFFLFFAGYFLLHLALPVRWRPYLIIVGSTLFYAWWKVGFVWIPYLLMAIAFYGVLWMERAGTSETRRRRMVLAVIALFLPLAFFKYTNFLYRDVIGPFFGWTGTLIDLPLPLGVSFVTFTLTAYIVDCWRGRFEGRRKLSTVLAYVLFFPHLIAGPILRPIELIPQLEHPRPQRRVAYTAAIAVFTLGLVKKLVFADPIGEAVDAAYAAAAPDGPQALLALYGFAVQIYCDFSGYTDMAIGLAMLLGIRLPRNFARPYMAAGLSDFWRRWHITLSSWLRDYLYIPLGGSRGGMMKDMRNIMITMLLGGLWHGAHWTFVIWGGVHGLGIAAMHLLRRFRRAPLLPRWLSVLLTFHFVTAAWAFFRAATPAQALHMLVTPFLCGWSGGMAFITGAAFPLFLLAAFFMCHPFDDHRRIRFLARRLRPEILWPLIAFFWIMAITVSQGSSAKFVYFDF
ncbi:MAG: MBOAT family protein [Pseudomonadota bacterium]|nr:MBOAT family protein [Pseudomonadota bacterium]